MIRISLTQRVLTIHDELYVNNEWTWKNWEDIMSSYVGNAPADTERYGVNGFFRAHVVQQTGKRSCKL